MNEKRNPGPIPNRWLQCPRKSDNVIAERFIAFKTPLSKDYNDQLPLESIFLPDMIFGWCKTVKLKLGLWIDLTNTKRFYDRKVVEDNDAKYVKLQCRGHGETPSIDQTQSFINIVSNFIDDRPLDMIGVHCTHGFNRTGFLIVSYMVERLDCSVEAALSCFAQSRPPGIYKQDYINELYNRYENGEEPMKAPELPNWCLEYDDSDSGVTNYGIKRSHDDSDQQAQGSSNGNENDLDDGNVDGECNGTDSNDGYNQKRPRKKRRRELVIKEITFMQGVPGVEVVTDKAKIEMLQQKVQDMCGWEKSGFPGSQPVSMDRKNLHLLHEMPYRVSWKADGNRYMMLINDLNEVYFIDRNNSCFQVNNLTFPKAIEEKEHLKDTLVDGEMVIDRIGDTCIPRYLIYDIVRVHGSNVGKLPFFPNRLHCIKTEIIAPRHKAIAKGVINREAELISVRQKDFWDLSYAAILLGEKFSKTLTHEPDGLIFQPDKQPYAPGVCTEVLKWKPSELNSVDFRLKIIKEEGLGILTQKVGLLYVGGFDQPLSRIPLTKELRKLDNKIIECTVNSKNQWEFLRERTDKTLPNSYNTAISVIESIREPVTKDILLHYISMRGFRNDHDKMPPPSTLQTQKYIASHPQQHPNHQHPNHQHPNHQHQQPHKQHPQQ